MESPDDDQRQQKNAERIHPLVGSLLEIIPNHVKSEDDSISSSSTSSTRTCVQGENHNSNEKQSDTESSSQSSTSQLRDQMIESLVRFSYHTPIVVLEDLINHQIQIEIEKKQANNKNNDFRHRNDTVEDAENESLEESVGLRSWSPGEHDAENSSIAEMEHFAIARAHSLPPNRTRESALVFVDISGFTKLSTMLDEETLSRVINSYFEMIISEVRSHGGDILKFAGDALFAEWRVPEETDKEDELGLAGPGGHSRKFLKELNSFLVSMDCGLSKSLGLSIAVLRAARCAVSIVHKYSDHEVAAPHHISDTMGLLNVHCGIGCGVLVGMHASDYKEEDCIGEEDQPVETRREYLFLGSAIDQVRRLFSLDLMGIDHASHTTQGFQICEHRFKWGGVDIH
jgi:class 3 adenylate cyclase